MPAPADEPRDRAADPQAQRASKQRYRTVIPAPSGNYAFIKTIGQGSMGKVKLAKKEGTNELASHAASCQCVNTWLSV
jgi:serine/threonine protein kinase